MTDPLEKIQDEGLRHSLQMIRELMGSMERSRDLQDRIPGFKTQKGIYKPQNSNYALWVRQTSRGIYPDQDVTNLPDGSWLYRYTPEAKNGKTDMSLSTNNALLNSMDDRVPVGVFIQKKLPGSDRTYEVMGLAYVEEYDGKHFVMHGEPIEIENRPMAKSSITPFQPFETYREKTSESTAPIRQRAFQTAVRRVYHEKCSLCEIGFRFHGEPIGLEAAHIIPVSDRGTSIDIRNGILLCRNHHILFDSYLWTFDEDFRVRVSSDRVFRESAANNHVLKAEGRKLANLPVEDYDLPAVKAIDYRLDLFEKNNS